MLRRNQRVRLRTMGVVVSALLRRSITISDVVFMITQLVNIIALAIILVLARRFRNHICTAHARQLHVLRELCLENVLS
ncbi:hypothetical protein ABID65_009452 [Bradyrhizobium sp. S3.9.2]